MVQNLRPSLQRLWQHLTWTQRLSLLGLTLAVLGALAAIAVWANTPSYGVLFSGLSNQDAGAIINQLNTSKVPYQLDTGGSTILVPVSIVDKERIQLAQQNLPAGDVVGFEAFNQTNVFQTDPMVEQVNYTRALEGELTRTISQISGVAYTRVNIVVPQQQLFTQQQANPTASVLVKMLPGASLTSDQIAGIQHLVASGVQGLKPEDVVVVDGTGNILSVGSTLGGGVSGLTVLAAQGRYAATLGAQLTAMLDAVLGPDKAIVRVNDTMDFTQTDVTSNTYDPQSPSSAVNESHIVTNTAIGPSTMVGGIAGLASNVPTYGTSVKSTSGVTQTQQSADIMFAHSNTVAHVTRAPGSIQSLSVAVLLDSRSVKNAGEIQTLQNAVAVAAGLNVRRGDRLTISAVPFDTTAQVDAVRLAAAASQQDFILNIARWAALIVVPLVLLFLLRRMLVASRDDEYDDLPTVEEVQGQTPLLPGAATPSIQDQQRALLQRSMSDLAREKPELVAGVISRWIEEDVR